MRSDADWLSLGGAERGIFRQRRLCPLSRLPDRRLSLCSSSAPCRNLSSPMAYRLLLIASRNSAPSCPWLHHTTNPCRNYILYSRSDPESYSLKQKQRLRRIGPAKGGHWGSYNEYSRRCQTPATSAPLATAPHTPPYGRHTCLIEAIAFGIQHSAAQFPNAYSHHTSAVSGRSFSSARASRHVG